MKNRIAILGALALMVLVPLSSYADEMAAYKQMVEGSDAVQAMALANQWKWTQDSITSHVTSKEVVFEFPDNTVKKVALPEDKMVVAIAPYLTFTHG